MTGTRPEDKLEEILEAKRRVAQRKHEWEQAEGYFASIIEAMTSDIRRGCYDDKLDQLKPTIDEIERASIPERFAPHFDQLRAEYERAMRRQQYHELASEESTNFDPPLPPPILRLKCRLGTVREASHELCLTPEQVEILMAEGDDV
jgi:hypothetical protein